jgi:hypothetical protein
MSNAKPQNRVATGTQTMRPAAMKILSLLLRNIKFGQIQLVLPDGEILTFGRKSPDGPAVLKVHDIAFFNRTLRHVAMGFLNPIWMVNGRPPISRNC